ncbi:MAG: CHAP domain-containing protein [Firmicutes bacterium]|nr:CHAP domain-containing protein [Bacillota bacterium]
MRRQDGFTLVELLVSMLCMALVVGAVSTVMLLGLRMEVQTSESLGRQQTAGIVFSMLDKLTGEGKVKTVEFACRNLAEEGVPGHLAEYKDCKLVTDGVSSWKLLDKATDAVTGVVADDANVLVRYDASRQAITSGSGAVLLENVETARLLLTKQALLTFDMVVDGENYTVSTYCRTAVPDKAARDKEFIMAAITALQTEAVVDKSAARAAFLTELVGQYGSEGFILNESGAATSTSFSKWYNAEWADDTPWCATYLSWGLAQLKDAGVTYLPDAAPRYGNIETWTKQLQMSDFLQDADGNLIENPAKQYPGDWLNKYETATAELTRPSAGDLVFFDWDGSGDADHVGAVVCVQGDELYTIEGNSNGRVQLQSYPLGAAVIMGYGVMSWN